METKFLPHNFVQNCVVLTGAHDNDTTRAFFETTKLNKEVDIYDHVQKYLNYFGDDLVNELIRAAYASVANIVIVPLQDILNLGGEARMNFPGKLGGNWMWRFTWNQIPNDLHLKYFGLAQLYERPPKPKKIETIET
jgi:4-alpha-glucanotransferase